MSGSILVRAPQWFGDAVVSTVFIDRVKAVYPSSVVDVLCVPSLTPLFDTHPSVRNVVPLPYPEGGVTAVASLIRSRSYNTVYILPRSFRSALESYLAGVPTRIGYSGDLRRWLLTSAVAYDSHAPYAARYLRLLGGEIPPLETLTPYMPVSEISDSEFEQITGKPKNFWPRPWLGVAPASIAPARTWPSERFAQATDRFQSEVGGTAFLFGTGKESIITNRIVDLMKGRVLNTAGRLSLPQLGWFLKNCDLLAANDSGIMHAASAFRLPTVVVFGASDPAFAVPPWGRVVSLQRKDLFCVPCLRNHCVRLEPFRNECLMSISVEQVTQALFQQYAQLPKHSHAEA